MRPKTRWARALVVTAFLLGGIGGGMWYLFGRIYATEEQTCLASIISKDLDKLALQKGEQHMAIAEQQAEVIGRLQDRLARERGRTHCAEALTRRIAQSRWNYFTGPKNQSPRWHLVYAAAGRVLTKSYKRPLPPNCKDVKAYRQTRLRGWKAAWENRGSEGFAIANMQVYCD